MLEILRDSVWQFIGAVLALIAIGVTIAVFMAQRLRKRIAFDVLANIPLLTVSEESVSNLKLYFDGVPLDNATLFLLRILNAGNAPIATVDYEHAIRLEFAPNSKILAAEIVDSLPDRLPIKVIHPDRNVAEFSPCLLNPGDSFTCRILGSDLSRKYAVTGRIAGVGSIESMRQSTLFTLSPLVIGATIFVALFLSSPSPKSFGWADLRDEELPYAISMFLIMALTAFLQAFVIRRQTANRLRAERYLREGSDK